MNHYYKDRPLFGKLFSICHELKKSKEEKLVPERKVPDYQTIPIGQKVI